MDKKMYSYYILVTEPGKKRATGRLTNGGIAINKIRALYWATKVEADGIAGWYNKNNDGFTFTVKKVSA
jgi:hypothetical protein